MKTIETAEESNDEYIGFSLEGLEQIDTTNWL